MRLKKIKLLLASVIILSVGVIFTVFLGYRQAPEAENIAISTQGEDVSVSIGRVRQTATRDGVTEWSLNAASVKYLDEQKKAFFQDVAVTFFLKNGNNLLLTADSGVLRTDSNDIEVSGNVVVKNLSYRMETEILQYLHEKRMIFSESPVTITGDAFDLRADSMSVDLNNNAARLQGNVKGNVDEQATL